MYSPICLHFIVGKKSLKTSGQKTCEINKMIQLHNKFFFGFFIFWNSAFFSSITKISWNESVWFHGFSNIFYDLLVYLHYLFAIYRRILQVFFGSRRIYFCCPKRLYGHHYGSYLFRHKTGILFAGSTTGPWMNYWMAWWNSTFEHLPISHFHMEEGTKYLISKLFLFCQCAIKMFVFHCAGLYRLTQLKKISLFRKNPHFFYFL